MKKILNILLLFCLLCPTLISAKDTDVIAYDTTVTVAVDRTFTVQENYYVLFLKNETSYTHNYSLRYPILYQNGKKETVTSKIENLKVDNHNFSVKQNYKSQKLQILGNFQGNQTENFKISYQSQYDKGINNEFYLNLVDSNFEDTVSNVSFTIEMPKEVSKEQIHFYLNQQEITNSVPFQVQDRLIIGNLNDVLENHQTFSILISLPDAYFEGIKPISSMNWSFLIPSISLLVVIVILFLYQKNNRHLDAQYEPPNQFDSAEISYLYHGYTINMDIATLFLEFANDGYLEIEEQKENIIFHKVKEYDKNNAIKKILFEDIFHEKSHITLEGLKRFLQNKEDCKKILDNEEHHAKLFHTNQFILFLILIFLFLSSCSILFKPTNLLFHSTWFSLGAGLILTAGLFLLFMTHKKKVFFSFLGLVLLCLSIYIGISPILDDTNQLISFGIGFLLTGSLAISYHYFPKRSKYGNQMLREITNFQNTLFNISSTILKEIVSKDPFYFYRMLPYTYVLKIESEWFLKGRSILLNPPTWYHTYHTFHFEQWMTCCNQIIRTLSGDIIFPKEAKIIYEKSKLVKDLED